VRWDCRAIYESFSPRLATSPKSAQLPGRLSIACRAIREILKARIATKLDDTDIIRLIDLILPADDGVLDEAYEMVFFRGDGAASRPAYREPDQPVLAGLRPSTGLGLL
jgi:hypothetical protein